MNIDILSLEPLAEIQRRFPGVRLFLFGSVTQKAGPISDIDLLALYETLDSLWALKQALNVIIDDLQLHVVYMSAREESQFDFIAGQQAVSVDNFFAHMTRAN